MTEQDRIAVVQKAYEAFGRGDLQGLLGLMSEDVDWEPITGLATVPTGGKRRGPAEVQQFFSALGEHVEFRAFEPKEYFANGDKVVALGHYDCRVRSTGRSYDQDWAMVFTIRDGRIARFREYTDTHAIANAF